jgi:hypothetical protein
LTLHRAAKLPALGRSWQCELTREGSQIVARFVEKTPRGLFQALQILWASAVDSRWVFTQLDLDTPIFGTAIGHGATLLRLGRRIR